MIDVAKGPKAGVGALRLSVPPGLMLRNGNGGAQSMVAARLLGRYQGEAGGSVQYTPATVMTIFGVNPVTFVLDAYCAEFTKITRRRLIGSPSRRQTRDGGGAAQQAGSLSVNARQAVVWMQTDKVTYEKMNASLPVNATDWNAAQAAFQAAATPSQTSPELARPVANATPVAPGQISATIITDKARVELRDPKIPLSFPKPGLWLAPTPLQWIEVQNLSVTDPVVPPPGVSLQTESIALRSLKEMEILQWHAFGGASHTTARLTFESGTRRDVFLWHRGPLRADEILFTGGMLLEGAVRNVEVSGQGLQRVVFARPQ